MTIYKNSSVSPVLPILVLKKSMVQLKDDQIIITINTDNPQIFLEAMREGMIDVIAAIIESDELIAKQDLRIALSTLVKLQEHLTI